MNSLLICPHCSGAISRVTRTCPTCGAATNRNRKKGDSPLHDAAPQSTFLIVIDVLRSGPGRHHHDATKFKDVVRDT